MESILNAHWVQVATVLAKSPPDQIIEGEVARSQLTKSIKEEGLPRRNTAALQAARIRRWQHLRHERQGGTMIVGSMTNLNDVSTFCCLGLTTGKS